MHLDESSQNAYILLIDAEKEYTRSIIVVGGWAGIWWCTIIGLLGGILDDGVPFVTIPKQSLVISFWCIWAVGIVTIPIGAIWIWKKRMKKKRVETSIEVNITDDVII